MKSKKTKIIVALLCAILATVGVFAVVSSASDEIVTEGEMIEIKNDFASYLVQDTRRIANDGFVGALQYTVYYKGNASSIVPELNGTPIMVYAINTNTERVGTDSNKSIIQSMLDRGYAVVVLDYLNNPAATGHKLDDSAQTFVNNLKLKKYFNFDGNNKQYYKEVFVVPSGYDVLLNQVFWEVDKHSLSGTLEYIVENWNTDFKGTKAERLVKWATGSTTDTRKTVSTATDGTSPVWYDASGKVDANGLYTKVKYTVAKTITDCVKPDGSPLDMDMKLHLVYPTNPEKEVPLLSVSCCWGYPTNTISCYTDLCSHHTGALFRGYAGAVYDYFWQPMARDSAFGYYDGNLNTTGAVTGHHMNYSLHIYNDKLINTAAIRYLRYLALSDSETYKFDLDAFCTIGLSKGAWFSFLGEEVLQEGLVNAEDYTGVEAMESAIDEVLASFACKVMYDGHSGETRYQAGENTVISGGTYVGDLALLPGEKQPWLTYNGKEIISGVQLTYAANGSQEEDVSGGHVPIFAAAHMNDEYNAAYGSANTLANLARSLDIPFVFFEVDQLHEYAYYPDMFYGVPTYDAFFSFANYYLKNEAIKVFYTDPYKNDGDISLTDKITVQFSGATTLSEVEKITITSGEEALRGTWESIYGGTQWTFSPENMKSGTTYTITVPATLKGDNGVEMGEAYTSQFTTRYGTDMPLTAENTTYYSFTVPASMPQGFDTFNFRFAVSNNAANVANLYAVDTVGAAEGTLVGSVNLKGAGTYEIDVTKYLLANAGNNVTLMLKGAKTAGTTTLSDRDFSDKTNVGTYGLAPHAMVMLDANGNEVTSGGDSAIKVYVKDNEGQYGGGIAFYENVTTVLSMQNLLGTTKISKADYGRQIELTLKIFDTTSRTLQLKLNSMTSSSKGIMDYGLPLHNITTKAGEWMTITIPYVVYDTDYGTGSNATKTLYALVSPTGDTHMPIYFSNLTVKETVTDLDVTGAYLSAVDNGRADYKTPEADTPFALYNGESLVGAYTTWKAALGAYVKGYTLKLTSDYVLTNADVWGDFGAKADSFVIDLNGYTIYSENTSNSLIWLKTTAKSIAKTTVTLKNGGIVLNNTPIVSYESSSVQGFGKEYDVKLENLDITLGNKAMLTELISASSIPAASGADVNITLNECDIDLGDEDNRSTVMLTLFPEGKNTLTLAYTVKGGSLTMSHPRWITVQAKATYVDYVATENGNMKLYIPSAYAPSTKVSYIIEEGYAQFAANTSKDNVTEYVLKTAGEGSTRYGIIPDAYLNAETYPFVLFKDGAFVGAYSTWNSVLGTAQNTAGGAANVETEVQIVLRRDYKNVGDAGPQINKATNILIDLGGNSLITEDVGLDFSANYSAAPYATNFVVRNGKILSGRIAFLDGQLFNAATGVKVYNVRFEGVTFGFDSALGDFWSDMIFTPWTNVASSVGTDINVTYENCIFDLRNYPLTKNYTVFNASDGNRVLNVNTTIVGGEILMDSAEYVTFAKTDANDTMAVAPDADGNYVTLKVKSGVAPLSAGFVDETGRNRAFNLESDDGVTAVYTLKDNPLATDYGVIGNAYADASVYPFAVFKDGTFVGGYSTWNSVLVAAQNSVNGASNINSVATILLRRDFTSVNRDGGPTINTATNIVLDLNGYDLACDWVGFDLSGNYNAAPYATSVTVKNGTVLNTCGMGFVDIQHQSGAQAKEFKVTFDNVTFGFAPGATTSWGKCMLFEMWGTNAGAGSHTTAVYNDCTFNLCDNVPSAISETTKMNIFPVSDGNKNANVNISINGGTILVNNINLYNIFTGDENDSIIWNKGADGRYTRMVTPTTAAYANVHYTGTFNTPEGTMYFIEMEDNGTNSTYELDKISFEYGEISLKENKLLSAVDFPFVAFLDGVYKAGYGRWRHAIDGAKGFVSAAGTENKTVVIVQRRNYDAISAHDSGSNFNNARGKIVLDLNGYTITNIDNYFIDIYVSYSNTAILGFKSSIEIKNGTLINARSGAPMIAIGHTGTNANYDTKKFGFTFTNVTFKFASGVNAFITEWNGSPHVGDGTDVDYFFDGCTFDFTDAASGTTFCNAANNVSSSSVIVRGGNIIADSFAGFTLYKVNNDDVSYIMADNTGKYMTLTQLAHVAAPNVSFKNAAGKILSFGKDSVNGLYAIYVIGEPTPTKYGDIPYQYYSKDDYPFAVFDEKGNFLGAFGSLLDTVEPCNNEGAIHAAKVYMSANTWDGSSYGANPKAAFIVMRRDYKFTSIENYHNLAQVQGIITIDLNGYTLTAADNRVMFDSSIKPWINAGDSSVFPSEFYFKNGTVELVNRPMIHFVPWMAEGVDVSGKAFVYQFDNVTFNVIGTTTNVIATYATHSGTPEALANPELRFNNCTFNLERALDGTTLFGLGNGLTNTKITVEGGKIIAGANGFNVYSKSDATTTTVTFTKADGENYLTITLPKGVSAPAGEYDIAGGKAVFVKVSENESTVTYRLRNAKTVDIDFTPKMSITLGNELSINVYIPVESVQKFTFNGITYENLEAIADKKVTVDGKDYYRMTVALGSAEAAKDIKLAATVTAGENTAVATFTFSIPKYATKVLTNGTDVEKTLAKDVLAYVKAAYNYFTEFNTAEEIARVNALIDSIIGDYKAEPVSSGETNTVTPVTSVTLNLDSKPSIRFYVTDTTVEFFANGRKLDTVTGTDETYGAYVELDVYAYALSETITYGNGGSYHISDFLEGAKGTNYENLVSCFIKYTESAADYRASVIGINN
ncbi:MAG: hypothetical protein E7673_02395 [Ruminococcaceae bacterium]|nr:hypothetical protein [Oscillospiraceae bacterium]